MSHSTVPALAEAACHPDPIVIALLLMIIIVAVVGLRDA
jgi:hypothetical protein